MASDACLNYSNIATQILKHTCYQAPISDSVLIYFKHIFYLFERQSYLEERDLPSAGSFPRLPQQSGLGLQLSLPHGWQRPKSNATFHDFSGTPAGSWSYTGRRGGGNMFSTLDLIATPRISCLSGSSFLIPLTQPNRTAFHSFVIFLTGISPISVIRNMVLQVKFSGTVDEAAACNARCPISEPQSECRLLLSDSAPC